MMIICLSVRHHDILESPLSGHFRIIFLRDYATLALYALAAASTPDWGAAVAPV